MLNIFLKGPEVSAMVMEARKIREGDKVFSDIMDSDGNYYVDFVQQGGGVLGIGLIGYTYILEQAGIRFYSLAGSSAGAINALLMASLEEVGTPVSEKILTILSQKNIFDFVDGPSSIKKLIQKQIDGEKGMFWPLVWNAIPIYYLLKVKLGLNPGKELKTWITKHLEENGIKTFADIKGLRKKPMSLYHRLDGSMEISPPKLSFITSEITTQSRVELPRMADIYWDDPDAVPPAEFVHASYAVPYFFYPMEKKHIPRAGEKVVEKWEDYLGYSGPVPSSVKFIDGGVLSNFPINAFHINDVPSRPTFGARLSSFRERYTPTSTFFRFSSSIINTMRQIHDYEVILRHPDYKRLICNIDADKEFNWLDFNMPKERQRDLFILGAKKGLEFLQKFDWEEYKETRRKLKEIAWL